MLPRYDLDKIKFATDEPTFERAVSIYESGKIREFKEDFNGYSAIVFGTQPYNVLVSSQNYDSGSCTCYLGQNDTLCKHMVAVAIWAVKKGRELSEEDKKLKSPPVCSNKLGQLTERQLRRVKESIRLALRFIKPYRGSSKYWFSYQDSLSEGCRRLSGVISDLPISKQTSELLVNMLLMLDKKLSQGGVDDSDGTVGGFIEQAVEILKEFTRIDRSCAEAFKSLKNKQTVFGWEEPLIKLI